MFLDARWAVKLCVPIGPELWRIGSGAGTGIAQAACDAAKARTFSFFEPGILPGAVRSIASFLPLEPLANGFQSQYVTDASGVGLDARNLGVLAAWTAAAIGVVALRGFHWSPRQRR